MQEHVLFLVKNFAILQICIYIYIEKSNLKIINSQSYQKHFEQKIMPRKAHLMHCIGIITFTNLKYLAFTEK